MNRAVSDLVSIPRGRRSAGRARRQTGRAPEAKRPPRPGPLALLRLRAPADPRHPLPGCAPRPRLGVDAALLADSGQWLSRDSFRPTMLPGAPTSRQILPRSAEL
jgi:hypothetical protein